MSITVHERPGVYSAYAASAAVSGVAGRKNVGLAVQMTQNVQGVRTIVRYEDAVAAFGVENAENVTVLIRLLLQNGAAQVTVFPVEGKDTSAYAAAFETMSQTEGLAVVMCDSTDVAVQQVLRDSAVAASAAQRERIAVVAGGAEESVSQLVERAG